jgi:anti-sigma B factor antagonist
VASRSTLQVFARTTGPGVAVVELTGELDLETLPGFRAALDDLGRRDRLDVVTVDTAGLTFADSSAVAALVDARATAEARGAKLRLDHVHGSLRRVLALTGLDEVFDTVDT